jgi:hypothetical protein
MRLVNHASELIHQIYQREKVEDVAQWRDAVQFPAQRNLEECFSTRETRSRWRRGKASGRAVT